MRAAMRASLHSMTAFARRAGELERALAVVVTWQARWLLRRRELDELRARERRVARVTSELVAVFRLRVRAVLELSADGPWCGNACRLACCGEAELVTRLAVVEVWGRARRDSVTAIAVATAM